MKSLCLICGAAVLSSTLLLAETPAPSGPQLKDLPSTNSSPSPSPAPLVKASPLQQSQPSPSFQNSPAQAKQNKEALDKAEKDRNWAVEGLKTMRETERLALEKEEQNSIDSILEQERKSLETLPTTSGSSFGIMRPSIESSSWNRNTGSSQEDNLSQLSRELRELGLNNDPYRLDSNSDFNQSSFTPFNNAPPSTNPLFDSSSGNPSFNSSPQTDPSNFSNPISLAQDPKLSTPHKTTWIT
ncbi:MAG: hypothetical protein HC904_05935 [Blastochloris sp.]|nr:hypothetical protein [Blastochloris sp.]